MRGHHERNRLWSGEPELSMTSVPARTLMVSPYSCWGDMGDDLFAAGMSYNIGPVAYMFRISR